MRLKKISIFVTTILMVLVMAMPVTAKAQHGVTGGRQTWKVLTLILPDASIDYGSSKKVSTMHYTEIERVQEIAKNMETWSTGALNIKVDVKVDYEDINSELFGMSNGYTIDPENIQNQIKRNSINGEYDSILVVYRSTNEQGYNIVAPSQSWLARSEAANGATYATLPLKDTDHKLGQFDIVYPEQLMVTQLLESVYSELSPSKPQLKDVPRYSIPGQNRYELMSYMMSGDESNLSHYWSDFIK